MTRATIVLVSADVGEQTSTGLMAARAFETAQEAAREAGLEVSARRVRIASHAADLARTQLGMLPGTELARDLRLVERADGLVLVTPVYQGSYSGLFKMFVDAIDPAGLQGTVVLPVAVGGSARHQLVVDTVLRPLLGFFGAQTTATGVYATSNATTQFAVSQAEVAARLEQASREFAALVAAR